MARAMASWWRWPSPRSTLVTPEGRVKAAVKRVLKALGAWYFMPVQTGRGVGGVPDFVVCMPVTVTPDMVGRTVGLFVGVETKAPGRRSNVSDLQRLQINAIGRAGGVAVVVDDAAQLRAIPVFRSRMEVLDADSG